MSRFIKWAMVLLALSGAFTISTASTASAETLTVVMRNNTYGPIEVEFWSKDRNVVWPGYGNIYPIESGASNSMALSCNYGEQICYGVWMAGDRNGTYWGVGPNGTAGCPNCCYTCEGGTTSEISIRQ